MRGLVSPPQQFPDRLAQRLADNVPQRIVEAGDGVHGDALLAIGFSGAPVDVPVALDVEGIAPDHQLRQMAHHDRPAARPAIAIAGDALVGCHFHSEGVHALGLEGGAGGLVFGIDVERGGDFHALGGPGVCRGLVFRIGPLEAGLDQPDAGDLELGFLLGPAQARQRYRSRGQQCTFKELATFHESPRFPRWRQFGVLIEQSGGRGEWDAAPSQGFCGPGNSASVRPASR